jgi:hypothetical protein
MRALISLIYKRKIFGKTLIGFKQSGHNSSYAFKAYIEAYMPLNFPLFI